MTTPPLPSIPEDAGPPLPDPTQAPTPSGHYAAWWPAMVDVPGLDRWPRARAYATPEGLYLWRKVPREGTETPDVWLPIRWDLTGPMPRDAMARIQGVYLATEVGIVHVTPQGGCGCASRLRAWRPSWAASSLAGWPGTADGTSDPTLVDEPEGDDPELEDGLGDPNSGSSGGAEA